MADIVSSLFGLSPREQYSKDRQQEFEAQARSVSGMYDNQYDRQNAYLGSKLGSLIGQGVGNLFGLQDPALKRMSGLEGVLQEAQQELGQDMADPTKLYPTLANKLQQRGFGREAAMVSMQGQEAINQYNLNRAKLDNENAQSEKFRAEAAKARLGDDPRMKIFNELAKNSSPKAVAQAIANGYDISMLDSPDKLVSESQRDVQLRQKIATGTATDAEKQEYKLSLESSSTRAPKVTNVMPGGSSTVDTSRLLDDFGKMTNPTATKLADVNQALQFVNMASSNPTAGAQLDAYIVKLVQDGKISNLDIQNARSGNASVFQKLGDSVNQWLAGKQTNLTLQQKAQVLKAIESTVATKHNKAIERFKDTYKTSPAGIDTINAIVSGQTYNPAGTPSAPQPAIQEGTQAKSKSGKPMVFTNGKWVYL